MNRKEYMEREIIYVIISIVVMIITMIYTKSSPKILIDIFSSIVSAVFPFADYVQMSAEEAYFIGIYIGILSEWFIGFINCFFSDEGSKVFIWAGNTFIALSISMLSVAMDDDMADNLKGFLILLCFGLIIIVIIVEFVKYGINLRAVGAVYKIAFFNPILIGLFISYLRLMLPLLFFLICILPLALIPIKIIQIRGVLVIGFVGYYIKQFSDKIIDKIDYNKSGKFVRFIVACIIIVAEIMLLQGYTLPQV